MATRSTGQALIAELYAELQRTEEEARRQLSRRLHNSTQQNLAALSMSLSLLERQLGATLSENARKTLTGAIGLVATCNNELREIAHTLSPPLLELGLGPALRALAADLGAGRMVLELEPMPRFDPTLESGAYRLVEEALTYAFSGDAPVQVRAANGNQGLMLDLSGQSPKPGAMEPGEAKLRLRARPLGARLRLVREPPTLRLHVRFPPTMHPSAPPY